MAEVQVNGTPRDGWRRTGDDDPIRAFEADGREAWSVPAGGKVLQLSGDPSGGLVALVSDRDGAGSGLRVFGPTGSGGGLIQGVGRFAIHPNAPLYYVHQTDNFPAPPSYALVGLDIGLGGGPGTPLTGTPGQPTVLLGGSVVVPSVLDSENLQLTFVRPTGAIDTQAVNVPNGSLLYPYRAVPNGQGGLLVQLRRRLWPGTETEVWDAVVVGVDAAGTLTGQTPLADDWGEIVVGEHGNILVTSQVAYGVPSPMFYSEHLSCRAVWYVESTLSATGRSLNVPALNATASEVCMSDDDLPSERHDGISEARRESAETARNEAEQFRQLAEEAPASGSRPAS